MIVNTSSSLFYLLTIVIFFQVSACSEEVENTTAEVENLNSQTKTVMSEKAALIVDDIAMANEEQGKNWLAFGRTYSEQRFSPLTQVNEDNVNQLGLDWYVDLPNDRGLVSTPLVVDGILYFVGSMNRVRAVEAVSGRIIWEFDPKVYEHTGNDMRVGWEHNRGIGIWKDKVYQATWDGRLIAIDRASGRQLWSVRTFPADAPLYITGAPKIFKGKVLIGNGGTENGPSRGYVTAYDAETGDQAWRFHIVPGNPADGFENDAMRMAAKTWTGQWWKHGGGGNAWHGFTYDVELDQLYIGTGNGAPWNRKIRSPDGGDNLFLCSVVALDPDTGEYLWHYQTTPGETWDYNSNMDIVLADLEIDGNATKALLHAPKNGFFYVIDRSDGKLLSAEPFSKTTWATHIDMKTGRPVEVPGARYEDGSAIVSPTLFGAHSWAAMSFNPNTGFAYIPAMHLSATYTDEGIEIENWASSPFNEGDTMGVAASHDPELQQKNQGSLQAFDPVAGKIVWEVPIESHANGGTMTTAGNLVFQGRADGQFVAYNATTGENLWSINLGQGISAPPITFSVNGEQYISLLVGWGGGAAGMGTNQDTSLGWKYGTHMRRLMTFSLKGAMSYPEIKPPELAEPLAMPKFEVDDLLAEQGAAEFVRCYACHGIETISAGMAPDLRGSEVLSSASAFASIVRDGSLKKNGMPQFAHLTDKQLLSLRNYVRREAESGPTPRR